MLLAAEDAENPQKRLTDVEVRDQAMTLFLAGHETTANALAWTWHLLTQHDDVRAKMKAEIDAVLGPGQAPALEDSPLLPYTTAVFSEAMRIYPPVWVVGRRALEDVTIGDYEVPRRTIVITSQIPHPPRRAVLARRARIPPRALARRKRAGGAAEVRLLSVRRWRRVCIGEGFAWTEGVILLAVMARRWRFEAVPGHEIEINPTVTLRPKYGLKMMVRAGVRQPGIASRKRLLKSPARYALLLKRRFFARLRSG